MNSPPLLNFKYTLNLNLTWMSKTENENFQDGSWAPFNKNENYLRIATYKMCFNHILTMVSFSKIGLAVVQKLWLSLQNGFYFSTPVNGFRNSKRVSFT